LKRIFSSIQDYPLIKQLYLIIDAVDESDDQDRRDILQLLFNLCLKAKYCIVKIFVASRPVVGLEYRLRKENHNLIRLQEETTHDISNFAYSILEDLNLCTFLDRATKYIVEHAQGVFLWVKLVKEELQSYIEAGMAENDVFAMLTQLPVELEDLYAHTLNKLGMNKPDLRDGIRMFRLVLFACQPLTIDELRHALAIPDDLDDEFTLCDEHFQKCIPDVIERRIIHCAGNLLEIKRFQGTFTFHREFIWSD
jgi:hypothetical protein